jgi:hypothetical protein
MAANGISTATNGSAVDTKIYRRNLKLDEAAAKRSTVGIPGYRPLNTISGTHLAYVNGDSGAILTTLSGSASPTVGHPWSTGTVVTTYGVEFRSFNGESGPGDVITTCNEGDVIWFDLYGTAIPTLLDAYLQFSGVNIENQDVTLPGGDFPTSNLLDPIPLPGINGDIPPGPAGSPILINADNLTEGNETLTLTWYINSTTAVTSTSITIVDTSITL